MSAWLRRIALALLVLVLTLAGLTARVVMQGEAALARSDAAFDRGDLLDSIAEARRAAIAYAPGAPHVTAAYDRLVAIAIGAEATGRSDVAQRAWDAIRGAALETRHVSTPHADMLDRANANLSRLRARAGTSDHDPSHMTTLLSRDDAPRAPWVAVLGAGFTLFAAGLGLGIRRGTTPAGKLSPRHLALPGLLVVIGVACWTLAVFRA
jgi:hypothetical protein